MFNKFSFHVFIFFFCFNARKILAVPSESNDWPMQLWDETEYDTQNTWETNYPDNRGSPMTYDRLLYHSQLHWNWVKVQPKAFPATPEAGKATFIVSCFYDPQTHHIYCSTNPKSEVHELLYNVARGRADAEDVPIWVNAVTGGQKAPIFPHAEDGTYYTFERARKAGGQEVQDKYPFGSMVASWGAFNVKHGTDPGDGEEVFPCFTGRNKSPGCQQVADALGVAYKTKKQGMKWQPQSAKRSEQTTNDTVDFTRAIRHPRRSNLVHRQDPGDQTDAAFSSYLTESDEDYTKTLSSVPVPPLVAPTSVPASIVSILNAAAASANSTAQHPPTTTAPPPPPGPPVCQHEADPDDDHAVGQCVCTQGSSSTTVAIDKGPNPCPWTALPITSGAAPAPVFTPPPQTGKGPFTETRALEVVACPTSVVSRSAAVDITTCASPSTVISVRPHATVQLGPSSKSVGTLSGDALSKTITSALSKLCPTPSPGQSAVCSASTTITGVAYAMPTYIYDRSVAINSTVLKKDGTLVISVPDSNYTSAGILDSLFQQAGTSFANSTSGKACNTTDARPYARRDELLGRNILEAWDHDSVVRSSLLPQTTLCGAVGFISVEYMNQDLNRDNPAAFLDVELAFHMGREEQEDAEWDCLGVVGIIEESLGLLAPELLPLDIASSEAMDTLCGAFDSIAGSKKLVPLGGRS